jgi:hypothetical protein
LAEYTADDRRSRTSEQMNADDADLRAGIDDLAGLVAGSMGLPELLWWRRSRCVRYRAPTVPG